MNVFKLASLFEVRYVDRAAGCERPHTHPSLIVSAITGGSISLQIDKTKIRLNKGSIAAIGPNVLHCVHSYSGDFAAVYVLEILGFPENLTEFDATHQRMFGHLLLQDEKRYALFIDLCNKLLSNAEHTDKAEWYSDWLRSLWCDRYRSESLATESYSANARLAAVIKDIIDHSAGENPPYEQVAQTTGYSEAHSNRLFKQIYRLSIQSYFLNKKAAVARNMLNCGAPLTDIAQHCGFYDQSHFSKVFKQIYQMSPQAYRTALSRFDHSCTRNRRKK